MILVTGATGNVGSAIVDELSHQSVPVRALTRNRATAHFPAGVQVVEGSTSDRAAMDTALVGVDAVFLNLVGDPGPCLRALAEAKQARVVLLSSLTAGTRTEMSYASRFAERESAVREAAPNLVVLRPGQFTSNVSWWRPMLDSGTVYAPFLDVALPGIAPEDVGAVAAHTLQSGTYASQTLLLSGPALCSPRDQIAAIAKATGRPLSAVEISEDQFRTSSRADADLTEYLIQVMGHPRPDELTISPTVAAMTGRPPLSFQAWVELHRAEFM